MEQKLEKPSTKIWKEAQTPCLFSVSTYMIILFEPLLEFFLVN